MPRATARIARNHRDCPSRGLQAITWLPTGRLTDPPNHNHWREKSSTIHQKKYPTVNLFALVFVPVQLVQFVRSAVHQHVDDKGFVRKRCNTHRRYGPHPPVHDKNRIHPRRSARLVGTKTACLPRQCKNTFYVDRRSDDCLQYSIRLTTVSTPIINPSVTRAIGHIEKRSHLKFASCICCICRSNRWNAKAVIPSQRAGIIIRRVVMTSPTLPMN